MKTAYIPTKRDIELFKLIKTFHWLSVEQIKKLMGRSHTPTLQALLLHLHQEGFLLRRPMPAVGKGNSAFYYHLSQHAQACLSPDDDLPRIRNVDETSEGYLFMRHLSTLNDVLIAAYLIHNEVETLELIDLKHDLDNRRTPFTVSYDCILPDGREGREKVTLIPDGVLTFQKAPDGEKVKQRVLTIEVDLGSEDRARIARKMRSYVWLGALEAFKEWSGSRSIRIVYLTTDDKRRDMLRGVCMEELEKQGLTEDSTIFYFGTLHYPLSGGDLYCKPNFLQPDDDTVHSLLWPMKR